MSAVLPGVADVCSQVDPYASAWRAHNVDTLPRPGRRWVVLGDSMSQSIGATAYDPAGSGSWPPAWPPLVTTSGSSTCPRPAHAWPTCSPSSSPPWTSSGRGTTTWSRCSRGPTISSVAGRAAPGCRKRSRSSSTASHPGPWSRRFRNPPVPPAEPTSTSSAPSEPARSSWPTCGHRPPVVARTTRGRLLPPQRRRVRRHCYRLRAHAPRGPGLRPSSELGRHAGLSSLPRWSLLDADVIPPR